MKTINIPEELRTVAYETMRIDEIARLANQGDPIAIEIMDSHMQDVLY